MIQAKMGPKLDQHYRRALKLVVYVLKGLVSKLMWSEHRTHSWTRPFWYWYCLDIAYRIQIESVSHSYVLELV